MTFWCDDIIRVQVAGPEGEREVVVDHPFALVGYGAQSDVVLVGPGVRKRALFLLATKVGVYALNLDRAEAPVDEHGAWLSSDDEIVIGPYRLRVRLERGELSKPAIADLIEARNPLPIPVLHIFGEGVLKDRRRLRHPLCLIGRRPLCSLQLRGAKVSSYHAALYWQDQRLWCIDLMSGNGSLRAGQPLRCSELMLGDLLEIGEFGLLYYRWSPRHTTPGDDQPPDDEGSSRWDSPLTGVLEDADLELSGSDSKLLSGGSDATEEQFQDRLVAAVEERLAAERQSLAEARAQWQAERESLLAELNRVKSARPPAEPAPENQQAASNPPPAEQVAEVAPSEDVATGERSDPSGMPATADSAEKTLPTVSVRAGSRRRAQPPAEIGDFVSGRLIDLEHSHRRRLLVIWTAAVAGTVALVALAVGVWSWLT